MPHVDDDLLKFEVPEIIHGIGAITKVGCCAKRLGGEKILVVTDPGIIKAGWVDETLKHLKKENLKFVLYDNVVSNPRDFQVEQGAQVYNRENCDVIVAVGGGSPIDTAKGVGILTSNHGTIHEYEGCNLVDQPVPPLICVPTTAGTGADVSQFAVVADTRKKNKMTILSRAIMPDISLIDPHLLQTKPEELMAATGMDTLTHAIEAYVSSLSWPLTDPHALHAIELVWRNLLNAVKYRDMESLSGMSIACLEAGIAFSNAILGAVHALAHPIGGLYDLHHGLINSILLPVVVGKNMEHAKGKFARIARAMGVDTREMIEDEAACHVRYQIEILVQNLGMPTRFSQLGLDPKEIPLLAKHAQQDLCMLTNPYCFSLEEIETMYREVW